MSERDRLFTENAIILRVDPEDVEDDEEAWRICEPTGTHCMDVDGTWHEYDSWWMTEGEARAALEAARAKYPPRPDWHDKPTCPGIWMCVDKKDLDDIHPTLCVVDQEEIDNSPTEDSWEYYGPIPPRKSRGGE